MTCLRFRLAPHELGLLKSVNIWQAVLFSPYAALCVSRVDVQTLSPECLCPCMVSLTAATESIVRVTFCG